jgi:hypothetical protein
MVQKWKFIFDKILKLAMKKYKIQNRSQKKSLLCIFKRPPLMGNVLTNIVNVKEDFCVLC